MHKAAKFAIGCLLAPIGIGVLMAIFLAGMHMAGVPEEDPTTATLEQDLPIVETSLLRSDPPDDSSLGGETTGIAQDKIVLVKLELSEGAFTIATGPADEGIRVDADYDRGSYELKQDYDMDGDQPRYTLRFGSTISFWRRIAEDGGITDEELARNQIHIQLPRDTPMELTLKIGVSETDIDLDGLALAALTTDFKMGEYDIQIREPNPIPMRRAELNGRMGEITFDGLAFLRAATISSKCAMGEVELDLGGPLTRDTEVIARMRMGEMRLNLPAEARWDSESRFNSQWGEINGAREGIQGLSEDAYLLSVDASVVLGEIGVDRYRARDSSLRRVKRD